MDDCPFCAQGANNENTRCYTRPDKYPVSKGHTLVLPKRHVDTWFEMTEAEQFDAVRLIGEVKRQLDEAYAPQGFNVAMNCGSAAGQTVPHAHIHIIPRYDGDVSDPAGGVRGVIPDKQKYQST